MCRIRPKTDALGSPAQYFPADSHDMTALLRRWTDPLLVLGLAAIIQNEIWFSDVAGSKFLLVPVGLLMTLPLLVRRRAPLAVSVVVMGAFAVGSLLDPTPLFPQTTGLAMVVAVYSVGAYAEKRVAQIGLVVCLLGIALGASGDVVVLGPLFAGIWFVGRLYRDRQSLAAALESQVIALHEDQEETARVAVAEERARIARELHDVVAHSLSLIVVQAGAERLALDQGTDSTRDTLISIERTGRQALTEMRQLVGILRQAGESPELAPQPSMAQLDGLVDHVRRAGLPIELSVVGESSRLPPGLDISAFRIIQESLTNVLKHAGPARVLVSVRYGEDEVELEIVDDGRGPSAEIVAGHGLHGMRERVVLHRGELETGPGGSGGYRVWAKIPFDRVAM